MTAIMKLTLTLSPQKLDQEAFVCILLAPQMIVTNHQDLATFSAQLSVLLQLPVVLVGQGTGAFWQSFGEQRFAARLNQIGLPLLVWQTVEMDVNARG